MPASTSAFLQLTRRLRAAALWCSRTRDGKAAPVEAVLHVAGLVLGGNGTGPSEATLVRALRTALPHLSDNVAAAGVRRCRNVGALERLTTDELRLRRRALQKVLDKR